jgi:aspartyl-tRNA synthetase
MEKLISKEFSEGREEKQLRRTMVSDLSKEIDNKVKVSGWVNKIRNQKKMSFLLLKDETGIVQVTIDNGEQKELHKIVSDLTPESAISIEGKLIKNEIVKIGGVEILPSKIEVENLADKSLPIEIRGQGSGSESRMDWRFLDLRRPENRLVLEIQTAAEYAMRQYWKKEGFFEIHSPKLMSTPSESGAELFGIENYFGKQAYLAQSPQFYKQYAIASGLGKVFEIGPVFRANPSFTSRHDTEFTSVDVEISWVDSHEDIMSFEEKWLQYVLKELSEQFNPQIRKFYNTEIVVPTLPFPRIPMKEVQEILSKEMKYVAPANTKKDDLDPQGEKLIAKYVKEKWGHEFLFITDWSKEVRPFYHMRYENDPNITKSYDLLWKGLEVTTGAQREHRYDVLLNQAREKGLNLEPLKFYLDLFKYGTPPHGGFGFGLTRMLMQSLELSNVRDATFLYRGPNRLYP